MSAEIIPLPLPPSEPERFRRPTFDMMRAYGKAIQMPDVEVEKCFDYYESNGWKVGRNPMQNWQAAMRNWKRNLGKYTAFVQQTRRIIDGKIQTPSGGNL